MKIKGVKRGNTIELLQDNPLVLLLTFLGSGNPWKSFAKQQT